MIGDVVFARRDARQLGARLGLASVVLCGRLIPDVVQSHGRRATHGGLGPGLGRPLTAEGCAGSVDATLPPNDRTHAPVLMTRIWLLTNCMMSKPLNRAFGVPQPDGTVRSMNPI